MGMKWVLYIFLCLLALTGCKTKYVSVPERHTEYIVKTDTFAKVDSVYQKDSVFVYQKGDTVIVKKIAYRDRYRNVYKTKCDTIYKRDSVAVPYPVERQLTKFEKFRQSLGWIFMTFAVTAGAVLAIVWWYHNKKC